MKAKLKWSIAVAATLLGLSVGAQDPSPMTMATVMQQSSDSDWRTPDPEHVLYLELASGLVIIELAHEFAPEHVKNIQALVRGHYFDGLAIMRSQENYVVQWGDPMAGEVEARSKGEAQDQLDGEYFRPFAGLDFTPLPDPDAYAPLTGISNGFPTGTDGKRAWLAHCYAMVGAGRGMEPDSGSGAELYVVIGHAPRHLDRNVTLVGKVLKGMEHLSTLPRGSGGLGFYEEPDQYVPIKQIRLESLMPEASRTPVEVLKTSTETYQNLIKARRHRKEEWFIDPTDHVGLCNMPVPVRDAAESD